MALDFQGSERFNDKHLHLLKSFTSLKSLNLEGIAITDDGLKEISELKSLRNSGFTARR